MVREDGISHGDVAGDALIESAVREAAVDALISKCLYAYVETFLVY